MADGKIRIWRREFIEIRGADYGRPAPKLSVPKRLSPQDFDWEKSTTVTLWQENTRAIADPRLRKFPPRRATFSLELSKDDVVRVLCGGASNLPSVKELPEKSPVEEAVVEPAVETVAEPAVKAVAKKRLTIGEQARAATALGKKLNEKPQISKAEAKHFLSDMGLPLNGRPFQRVWEKARLRAGLSEKARPGRKRKSLR
jgi:hypothetical protein